MNEFMLLKVLDKLQPLFTKMDIDYPVMRQILQLKLTMDTRRVPTIFNDSNNKSGNQFLKSLAVYALMGLMLLLFIFGDNYLMQMSIYYAVVMFILMTSVISDFSSVLLDVRDKMILHTKPVNERTINCAKVLHITFYLVQLTIAFTAISLVVGLVQHGIVFFLLSLLILVFVNLLILIMVAFSYIFILRYFDGEKLKDIINYMQILLSVSMIVGYQLVIRSYNHVEFSTTFSFEWWQLFLPPFWYGAIYQLVLADGPFSSQIILLASLGVIVPIIALLIYIQLIPTFERNLEKLMSNNGQNKRASYWWSRLWEKVVIWNHEEKVVYRFAVSMLKNERDFKLKVYPLVAMSFVFPFIFLLNSVSFQTEGELGASNNYFWFYFSLLSIPTSVLMLKFSENHRAVWIFRASPMTNKKIVERSVLKAYFVRLFLPVYLLVGGAFCYIFSMRIALFLVAVLLATLFWIKISSIVYFQGAFPFSEEYKGSQSLESVKAIILMIGMGLFALIHYLIIFSDMYHTIFIVLLILANIILWRK
ncbi:hypothetical protein SH601_00390 [Gracilibacillus sp. S3-1-1]|uniref:Uncharacterized protein n=1 Tax=Gracilibacillus pellucidus TaxID=3095368 RepID=A0ACC6M0K4_9BACI|nr:hypothetical protein [Gracilibacillus sp. S3-1-1]MDX8044431.1 hypothetical protein [Gracilibacillus sp. S3-1-1]